MILKDIQESSLGAATVAAVRDGSLVGHVVAKILDSHEGPPVKSFGTLHLSNVRSIVFVFQCQNVNCKILYRAQN